MLNRRDVIYLYDGSLEGLFTVVLRCFEDKTMPFAIEDNEVVQQSLFCDYVNVETDYKKAQRVKEGIRHKISPKTYYNIVGTFLSNTPDKDTLIFEYICAGLQIGPSVNNCLTIDCVRKVLEATQRVGSEAHNYKGFVRFSELEGGIYYGEIEPVNNIIPLIAPHFARRYASMPFIIHDVKRKLCVVYNGKSRTMYKTDTLPKLNFAQDEAAYRAMWKSFYETVEIKERHNEKCRITHMPKRYWKHLTEMGI